MVSIPGRDRTPAPFDTSSDRDRETSLSDLSTRIYPRSNSSIKEIQELPSVAELSKTPPQNSSEEEGAVSRTQV